MISDIKNLSSDEREQLFKIVLLQLEKDLGVSLKIKIVLDKDNKIIPILYATDNGVFEFVCTADGTAGNLFVDDFQVS